MFSNIRNTRTRIKCKLLRSTRPPNRHNPSVAPHYSPRWRTNACSCSGQGCQWHKYYAKPMHRADRKSLLRKQRVPYITFYLWYKLMRELWISNTCDTKNLHRIFGLTLECASDSAASPTSARERKEHGIRDKRGAFLNDRLRRCMQQLTQILLLRSGTRIRVPITNIVPMNDTNIQEHALQRHLIRL